MKLKIVFCIAVAALLTGCAVNLPKWQTDKETPLSEVAVIHRDLDPNAHLVSVNGEEKGFGFIFTVRLPPGQHIIGFQMNPLSYRLIPADPKEPKDGPLVYYIRFFGEAGHSYEVRREHGRPDKNTEPVWIEIFDRETGELASEVLGSYHKVPKLKAAKP